MTIGTAAIEPIIAKRQVGFLLGIGILTIPFVFAWFILKPGYSKLARIVSFGWLCVATLIVMGGAFGDDAPKSDIKAEASASREERATPTLANYRAKIAPDAVSDVTRSGYPKLYAKLGSAKVKQSNDLDDWAALYMALSTACTRVDVVGVSDQSTRGELKWYGDCANGERFYASEAEAMATKARFESVDPSAPLVTPAAAAPHSAKFKAFRELDAVSRCDQIMKAQLVSPGSCKPAMSWSVQKSPVNSEVTITRRYRARNAFNAELQSSWRCEVDGETNRLIRFASE